MVGVVGAAADLVEGPALGDPDFVSVQVVLGLDVAEDEWVAEGVQLSLRIDFVKGLIEDVQFLLLHLDDAAHEDRAVFLCDFRDGVVEVFAEGGVDVGGEAGGVDAFFLLDHLVGALLAPALAVPARAALLVRLPLLLLRVTDPH